MQRCNSVVYCYSVLCVVNWIVLYCVLEYCEFAAMAYPQVECWDKRYTHTADIHHTTYPDYGLLDQIYQGHSSVYPVASLPRANPGAQFRGLADHTDAQPRAFGDVRRTQLCGYSGGCVMTNTHNSQLSGSDNSVGHQDISTDSGLSHSSELDHSILDSLTRDIDITGRTYLSMQSP